jgi:DNA transposition AAA+ family ATPase
MRRALDMVRAKQGAAMTMIAGAPGVGKTRTVQEFCAAEGYDAIYLCVARGEGKPSAIADNILSMFGVMANGKSLSQMRDAVEQYVGTGRVLVVDEAQHLTDDGIEWLRAASEGGGFDLVFAGDLALERRVNGLPQLQRRMLRPVVLTGVTKGDVEAFVADSAFAGSSAAVDALHAVARVRGGNLGNVENVLRLAELFAGASTPTLDHLRAAILDMKLEPKGGRA